MTTSLIEQLETLNLPEQIRTVLIEAHQDTNAASPTLIGQMGYITPHSAILEDAIIALAMGKNLLFKGPTGSGKTRLAEYLSYLFQKPMHSINCSVDLDLEGLLGFKTISYRESTDKLQATPEIEFVPGPVTLAMKQGHLLYIDEINMARPETLPILNGILDYRRRVTNPFTGEIVTAKPDFRVIAALNVGYVGTVPLNEALKNRFVVLDVPYLQGAELEAVLAGQSALSDPAILGLFVKFFEDILRQTKAGHIPDETASVRGLLDACDLAANIPPLRAIERAIASKLDDERERQLVLNIAQTYFDI